MKKASLLWLLIIFSASVIAQDYFPKNESLKEENSNYIAFIDGREVSLETHQTELWKRYSEKYSRE